MRTLKHRVIAVELCPSRMTVEFACPPIVRISADNLLLHMQQKVVSAILCNVNLRSAFQRRRAP